MDKQTIVKIGLSLEDFELLAKAARKQTRLADTIEDFTKEEQYNLLMLSTTIFDYITQKLGKDEFSF